MTEKLEHITSTLSQPDVEPAGERNVNGRLCTHYEDILHLIVKIRELKSSVHTKPTFAEPTFAASGVGSSAQDSGVNLFQNPTHLRSRVQTLFDRGNRAAREHGFSANAVEDGTFALAAFLDEAVSLSEWDQKEAWTARPISTQLFGLQKAGDQFYDRLDELMKSRTPDRDVLELYYLCLAIGFKGKYVFEPEKLDPITADLHRMLERDDRYHKQNLSVDTSSGRSAFNVIKTEAPPWYAYATALAIVILVWFAARFFAA